MNTFLILCSVAYVLCFTNASSLLLRPAAGRSLAKSFALDNLVEEFSLGGLKEHFGKAYREKREEGSPTPLPMSENGVADCLVQCLRQMINRSPQDVGNGTLICPKYDQNRIEELCDGYFTARRCLDQCPESPLKNLSMSGFKPLQFMCVDRNEDFKNYMPCLTSVCEEVQKQCEPSCGSFNESIRRLARIQQRGADMDVPEIIQTIADTCQLVGCVGNCSQEPITRICGSKAYDLQRDTILTTLSSMAQAMGSLGIDSAWPPQCQALLANTSGGEPATTPASGRTDSVPPVSESATGATPAEAPISPIGNVTEEIVHASTPGSPAETTSPHPEAPTTLAEAPITPSNNVAAETSTPGAPAEATSPHPGASSAAPSASSEIPSSPVSTPVAPENATTGAAAEPTSPLSNSVTAENDQGQQNGSTPNAPPASSVEPASSAAPVASTTPSNGVVEPDTIPSTPENVSSQGHTAPTGLVFYWRTEPQRQRQIHA